MFTRKFSALATLFGLTLAALSMTSPATASVLVSFDNNLADNPFRQSAINGSTSFGGSATDPDYNGGTSVTLTFSDPLTGVNITTQTSPNFTGATASFFGAEASGFGVGNTNLGRFERGEAFTLHTTHAMTLDAFTFHEWNGDEQLHISWVENGVSQSAVFTMTPGTGPAPSNVTVALSGITADANSDLVITNVSLSSANSSGRLRFRKMEVSLVPEPATLALLGLGGLMLLPARKGRQ